MVNTELAHFVRRLLVFTAVFALASVCLTAILYRAAGEPDWRRIESPFLVAKDAVFRSDPGINTVFVGSSVTFRQIDPAVVDATAGGGMRSYNLGNPGLYPLRSLAYLERLLDDPPPSLRLIVFELFRLDDLGYNYRSPEIMRITTPRGTVAALEMIATSGLPAGRKVLLSLQYLRALAYKSLGFGMLSYQATERALKSLDRERLAAASRGFYAKDAELALSADADNIATLTAVRQAFIDNALGPDRRRQLHVAKYAYAWSPTSGEALAERLRTLADLAEERGIRLVYLLPPLLTPDGVHFAFPAYRLLPPHGRIDLSDPRLVPELYQARYLYDLEHVDSRGSVLFSQYLGEALREPGKDD